MKSRIANRDFLMSGFRIPFKTVKQGDEYVALRMNDTEICRNEDESELIGAARKALYEEARKGEL